MKKCLEKPGIFLLYIIGSVALTVDAAPEKFLHGSYHIVCICSARSLERRVHGKLGQTDVHCVYRHLGSGDVPQGGASRHVGPIQKSLEGHLRAAADGLENSGRHGVGGVPLVPIVLDDNALVYRRAVHCIRLLRLIGVHCVGIVSGQHEAGGQHGEIVLS